MKGTTKAGTTELSDVVILGAGASGLAVAKALQDEGYKPVILEKGEHVGESWFHRHPQLTLNTHRSTSSLPGLRFPGSVGAFPTRLELIDYLHDYVQTFDLDVRVNTKVTRIQRRDQRWVLYTEAKCYSARHLVVATGADRMPYIPQWPGLELYQKPFRHSAQLGDIQDYVDKSVLVVGAGNSGVDVLNHLTGIDTGALWLSVRQGSIVIPNRIWGIPIQPVAGALAKLPVTVADALLSLTERMCFGDLQRYGLLRTRGGAATRLQKEGVAPAIDNGFINALKAGKVTTVTAVKRFTETSVVLESGEELTPDMILFATGYRTNLQPLLGEFDVLNEQGIPRFHGDEQDPSLAELWFTGMRIELSGFFLAAGKTGRDIATAISGSQCRDEVSLPPDGVFCE